MVRVSLFATAPVLCVAHFGVISPPMWTDAKGQYAHSNSWRNGGCGDTPSVPEDVEHKPEGCQVEWYTNATFIPVGQKPTIPADSVLRTYGARGTGCGQGRDGGQAPTEQHCREHPWTAPGTAPIYSPCGIDGGNAEGCPKGNAGKGGCAAGGYGHGPDARAWYQSRPRFVSEWQAGSDVRIKWGITANHGGGYSFRLCPKPANLMDLTEECFQQGSLEFVGNTSTAIFDLDKLNERTEFPALSISLPTGHWRQNPIPACGDASGGAFLGLCTKPFQFPPRVNRTQFGIFTESMAGFSGSGGIGGLPSTTPLLKWAVEDVVKVPGDLIPGDYVLSYRWDCEQTSQVWNMCADIKVTSSMEVNV